jgi:hypothetical protein
LVGGVDPVVDGWVGVGEGDVPVHASGSDMAFVATAIGVSFVMRAMWSVRFMDG